MHTHGMILFSFIQNFTKACSQEFKRKVSTNHKTVFKAHLEGYFGLELERIGKLLFLRKLLHLVLAFQCHKLQLNPILEKKATTKILKYPHRVRPAIWTTWVVHNQNKVLV